MTVIKMVTKEKSLTEKAKEVLDFLNEKAGRNYRYADVNMDFIKARIKSGIEVDDLKSIVAMKCREWKGTDMEKYLRPATLFNREKCEQYYGELDV